MLARDTFLLKDAYLSTLNSTTYTYEVELISLTDLVGQNSIIHTKEFKEFVKKERIKEQNRKYDNNINIRDLHPSETQFEAKKEEDIDRFKILNDLILSNNKRFSRRVTKKEIVYKKDKSRCIVSFIITKKSGIKMFALVSIEEFDYKNKFITIR